MTQTGTEIELFVSSEIYEFDSITELYSFNQMVTNYRNTSFQDLSIQ